MQLAAWELGIGSCLASIYDGEKARGILNFPVEWHLRIAISFGYPTAEALAERPARPEGRKDELVALEDLAGDREVIAGIELVGGDEIEGGALELGGGGLGGSVGEG
ncbi:hypothetical protein B4Q13_23760, partial [Lacticaseibacillus rhamnosus]